MTVEAIQFQNFMAFKKSGWIELHPITLLFGANSSGKSSIIRAIRLLQQSLRCEPADGSLRLTDENGVDLGSYQDLIHGQDSSLPIDFGLRFSINSMFLPPLGDLPVEPSSSSAIVELLLSYEAETVHKVGLVGFECNWLVQINGLDTKVRLFYATRTSIQEEENQPDTWSFDSDVVKEDQGWERAIVETTQGFLPRMGLNISAAELATQQFKPLNAVNSLLDELSRLTKKFLDSMDYLGPLRAEPRRYYLLPQGSEKWKTGEGLRSIRRYARKSADDDFMASVNKWMNALDLGSKMSGQVKGRDRYNNPILFTMEILDSSNQLGMSLKDVGFGAVQVLPVVIETLLLEPSALLIIEQPELHLHPRAQAVLGDLVIEAVKNGGRLLIETHSEHLLLRLRRRIAETAAQGEAAEIIFTPSSVAAYFVAREGSASKCTKINLDEFGNYKGAPDKFRNFFADDMEEVMQITDSALKAMAAKKRRLP